MTAPRTHNLDVEIDGRIPHDERVDVAPAAGGEATRARVSWFGGPFHQLRCEAPLPVAYRDELAIVLDDGTELSGRVLDADAQRHGTSNDLLVRLTRLSRGEDPDGA